MNLLGYLQRSSSIPASRPEPATSNDQKKVIQSIQRLEGKIDALKASVDASLGTLDSQVCMLETSVELKLSHQREDATTKMIPVVVKKKPANGRGLPRISPGNMY